MDIRLDGRVALVTGASKGIGRAIAAELAAAGAKVMISSRKQDHLEAAAASMTGDVAAFAANAGEPDQAEACIAACVERFGGLDILVNNAAANPYFGPIMGIDLAALEKTTKVNQTGYLVWTQLAVKAGLGTRPGGSILNVSSIGGVSVEPALGWYNVTKAAVIHLSRHLAAELAPAVRVNAILPGIIRTDFSKALWEGAEEPLVEHLPMKRLGEPDDVAKASLFLVSDAASWITGQTLVVDGGAAVAGGL